MSKKKQPIVIDLFCGAGGESVGIHRALGDDIKLFAVNHWQRACETHSKNFPKDECICQDIQTIIPTNLVKNRDVELMWASPECTNFSIARGGKPMDDQSRCTPFDILRWLSMLNVKRLIVENVKEFITWGPLNNKDRPIESRKGEFFYMFVNAIRAMGYSVEWRFLNAADYGTPTTRTRFFLQAVKGKKQIIWPDQTYAKTVEVNGLFPDERKPWIPASSIIDWTLSCKPIDTRKKPLADATMRRILNGIEKYWGEAAKPFLCRYNGGDNRNHSIDSPVPVLDTSNRYGLVQPMLLPQQSAGIMRPVSKPVPTIATAGAIGLVQPLIVEYYGNGSCHDINKPLPVVTTKDRFALVKAKDLQIGFRMLQPHELAAAQGFPNEYQFAGNKTEVLKQIGNAVCPNVAEVLAGALA